MPDRDRFLTIMTYNVHRCLGTDRQTSPSRIAQVIAALDADLVALQELPGARFRPDGADRTAEVREELARLAPERPYPFVERERCGNVVLSRYPMRLVRAGGIHSEKRRRSLVPRGALWVEVQALGHAIQVINTHLGLTPPERAAQVRVLTGAEWLKHPDCTPPVILCGDFNVLPKSSVLKLLRAALEDLEEKLPQHHKERTFPSRRPLVRLDHLFVSPDLAVESVQVPQTHLTRVASDHLPVVVRIRLLQGEEAPR